MKYNGWKNYETWLVSLHFMDALISDAENLESFPRDAADVQDAIEEYIACDIDKIPTGFFGDCINGVLSDCDFRELYVHVLMDGNSTRR